MIPDKVLKYHREDSLKKVFKDVRQCIHLHYLCYFLIRRNPDKWGKEKATDANYWYGKARGYLDSLNAIGMLNNKTWKIICNWVEKTITNNKERENAPFRTL